MIGTTATDEARPMRRDTIFRISSMTKPITAVATMILLEECVLRLDEPVDRLLPELADRRVVRRIDGPVDDTVPADRPSPVRDLLTFRMGFGGYFGPSGQRCRRAAAAERRAAAAGVAARARRVDAPLLDAAADVPARRAVALPHRRRRARGADRPGVRAAVRGVLARADLRATRDDRHRLLGADGERRPPRHQLPHRPGDWCLARVRCA